MAQAAEAQARREIRELSFLFEISQALDKSPDIREVVGRCLAPWPSICTLEGAP
jgi:hypothetical protein